MKRSVVVKVGVLVALIGVLVWAVTRPPPPPSGTLTPGEACGSQAQAWCYGEHGWCAVSSPFAQTRNNEDPAARAARRLAQRECYLSCERPYQARCLEHRSMDQVTSVAEDRRLRAAIKAVQASWR